MPQTSSVYINNNLRPVLGSLDECIEWHALTQSEGRDLAFALHIDTGMNRLGLSVDEAHILARDHADFMTTCTLVMSHLSSAEDVTDCATENQIARFETVKALFPTITASLSNSSGIFHPEKPFYDLVRPGYALYGGNPTPDQHNPMHPVVTLKGRIIQTRDVRAGEAVGYNGQWHASQNKRLAVIGVGYGDGYPRGATSTDAKREANMPFGEALIAGVRCAFAGRVSMDLITLDVTDVPEAEVHRGAVVTLIGKGLDLDIVANNAGTIGYELLTHFGARYERHYKER
jgi:alanine racemase